jgi:hypothetical protein
MKIQDMVDAILQDSRQVGTYPLPEIFRVAAEGDLSGIAVSRDPDTLACLAFVHGEPEGAIFTDEKGELYGDRAVIPVTGRDLFSLYSVDTDIVQALVMGCRIFEKTRVRQGLTQAIPEIGRKSEGIGHLTISVIRDGELQKGIRISLRKNGKIVGSDFTSDEGSAGFRLMHGEYDCIVQDRSQKVQTIPVLFTGPDQEITLKL